MDLTQLKTLARHVGWPRAIAAKGSRKLLDLAHVRVYHVRATPIDVERAPPPLAGIRIAPMDRDALLAASRRPELAMPPEFVRAALDNGDVAWGAWDGDRLVSYVWRTLSAAPHRDGILVRVAKPYCYIYKAYTLPEYRGQRLMPAIVLRSDPHFAGLGYTHRASFIHACNLASLQSARSLGSRFLGLAGYAEWFGRPRFFRTRAVRDIGFEFTPG